MKLTLTSNLCNRLLHKLPWGHNVYLLDRVKDPMEREWYIRAMIEELEAELECIEGNGEEVKDSEATEVIHKRSDEEVT